MKISKKIEKLVSLGQVEEAIKVMLEITSRYETKIRDEVILLSAEYHRCNTQNLLGLSSDDTSIRKVESGILMLSKMFDEIFSELQERSRAEYEIVIEAKFDIDDQERIEQLMNLLAYCSQDYSLKLTRIQKGSIIIGLEGTLEGYKRIEFLWDSKDLKNILGLEVTRVYRINYRPMVAAEIGLDTSARTVAKKYVANFAIATSYHGLISIPDTSIIMSTSEAIMLSQIAKFYGLKISGNVWNEIMKLTISKFNLNYVLKPRKNYSNFMKSLYQITHIATISPYIRALGELIIEEFERKFPHQEAHQKPKLKALIDAFGKEIPESDLKNYWNSY